MHRKIINYIKRTHDRYPFVFAGLLFLFAIFLLFSLIPRTTMKWKGLQESAEQSSWEKRSPLDGQVVNEGEEHTDIIAVMVDNHPVAWPQVGLKDAPVVYEVPVEGGLTRFMAIYTKNSEVEKVGPVRSARPYFLDWLREYGDALYMHCGGSPAALDLIKQENIFDANEFYNGGYYWRDNLRDAPHNLFIKSGNWQKLWSNKGAARTAKEWQGWQFNEAAPDGIEAVDIKEILIKYAPGYELGWRFNTLDNTFERQMNGKPHLEKNDQISAENILVQFVSVEILDEVGRRAIETVSQGEARVLRDGKIIKGIWKKEGVYDRTRFFNENGEE
ncbi:DUF3048 domain-containing protein, partial [Patescibacteria group bacterium]|nr:DUF3048 domain-containing protein [Patescibacteria group bacterium]